MVKANVFLPSVNAGEFSTKLESRIAFAKYPNGAQHLKNVLLQPHGGFSRRTGFRSLVPAQGSATLTLAAA